MSKSTCNGLSSDIVCGAVFINIPCEFNALLDAVGVQAVVEPGMSIII